MEWDHISLTVMDYYLSLVQMAIPGIMSADRGSKLMLNILQSIYY